jgi:hypothetical protein
MKQAEEEVLGNEQPSVGMNIIIYSCYRFFSDIQASM